MESRLTVKSLDDLSYAQNARGGTFFPPNPGQAARVFLFGQAGSLPCRRPYAFGRNALTTASLVVR